MKRLFKTMLIVAAVGVLALCLAGCGQKKNENSAASGAASGPKTIVFASDATYPPMQYMDENKNIVGFEVDVMKAVAKAAGFNAEFKNVAWDGIFAGLAAGKYDAISSCVSITDERKATMDFSDPIMEIKQMLVVPTNETATDLAGMKGKTLGAQIGTTSYLVMKDVTDIKVKTYDEVGLAMEDLVKGAIQGVVADSPVAVDYTSKKYPDKLKIAGVLKTNNKVESIGVAVKKGNTEVLDLINKGLAAIKADGTFDKIMAAHHMQ